MKKFWIFILVAILALGLTATASANGVCPEGGDWSSHQDPPLTEVTGAVEYCVKGGSVGAGGYLENGTYSQVRAIVDGNDHDLSHWSYRIEEVSHQYWLKAWSDADCVEGCLFIEVMDGDASVMGPFKTSCTQWSDPFSLETAGPWTNIGYNAGGEIGTLFARDVGSIGEPRECLKEPPDPAVRFDSGCGDDCIPRFFVGFEPGTDGDALVITGPSGVVYSYTGAVETREMARPGKHTWIIYRDREPIMRGGFSVDPCECSSDPYVSFQQGCVDGVPVIGIDFVGEAKDTLNITGNGRDLSYAPGVYREQMRPYDSYSWTIFQGETGVDKGQLLVEVCPVDPTPTPKPKDDPDTGPQDSMFSEPIFWAFASFAAIGVIGIGVHAVWTRKRA